MPYFITVSVINPSWDDIDKWVESFKDFTGLDPDDDPKAEMVPYLGTKYTDIGTEQNFELKFKIRKLFDTEQQANNIVKRLTNNLGKAVYRVFPTVKSYHQLSESKTCP